MEVTIFAVFYNGRLIQRWFLQFWETNAAPQMVCKFSFSGSVRPPPGVPIGGSKRVGLFFLRGLSSGLARRRLSCGFEVRYFPHCCFLRLRSESFTDFQSFSFCFFRIAGACQIFRSLSFFKNLRLISAVSGSAFCGRGVDSHADPCIVVVNSFTALPVSLFLYACCSLFSV